MSVQPDIKMEHRVNYLLECFRTANGEVVSCVQRREGWLKLQLATQVAVVALASGIEAFNIGVPNHTPATWTLFFATPVGLVFCLLYTLEDRAITHIVEYLGGLSNLEADLTSSTKLIPSLDGSPQMVKFAKQSLPYRGIAQFIVFFLISVGVAILNYRIYPPSGSFYCITITVDGIFGILILWVLGLAYRFRKTTIAELDVLRPNPALNSDAPKNGAPGELGR